MRSPEQLEAATGMPMRNGLADITNIPCRLVAEGPAGERPLATIAIPTYQRLDFLTQAVRSVLAQDFDRPFEIVIIDDDPTSDVAPRLLERLPELSSRNFRYFVNEENLGLYPNHNRGLELSRGEWIAFLNDDDLLEPFFLKSLFKIVDGDPAVQAIMPGKVLFDERPGVRQHGEGRSMAWRAAARALVTWNFLGRSYRRISAGKFFWGGVIGGSGGCLFRSAHLREVGGFYSEEHPTSDLWLMARYAQLFGLYQARVKAIRIRVAENESAKLATVQKSLYWGYKLQSALLGRGVPRWYGRLLPHIWAQHRVELREYWGLDITSEEVEQIIGARLPKPRRLALRALQTALRGF